MTDKHPVAQPEALVTAPVAGTLRTSKAGDLERYDGSAWARLSAYDAVKLASSRAFVLTGDVTGSALSDWSGNVSINTTVGVDTHAHSRPMFFLKQGGAIGIGNAVWTTLTVGTISLDPGGCRSGNDAILKTPGYWMVQAQVCFADNTAGQALARLEGASSSLGTHEARGAADGAGRWVRHMAGLVYSNGSHAIRTACYQNSGGTRNVNEWFMFGVWLST